jgi:formate dehydrogenase maturation protein FdhE
MTAPREDYCPACGSNELLPYAVIVGAAETYGYQCLACTVTWTVMQTASPPDPRAIREALRRAG